MKIRQTCSLVLLPAMSWLPADRADALPEAPLHFLSCCPGECESLFGNTKLQQSEGRPPPGPMPWKAPECATHGECPDGGYCYSWAGCAELSQRLNPRSSEEDVCLEFTPYGHCGPSWYCPIVNDSIDGTCPPGEPIWREKEEVEGAMMSECQGGELPACERWADEGRCSDPVTQGFMRLTCAGSCGLCPGEESSRDSDDFPELPQDETDPNSRAGSWRRRRHSRAAGSEQRRSLGRRRLSFPERMSQRTAERDQIGGTTTLVQPDVEPAGPWAAWLEQLRQRLQFGLRPAFATKSSPGQVKLPEGLKQRCGRAAVPWSEDGPAKGRETLKTMPLFFRLITLNTTSHKELDPLSELKALKTLVVMQQGGPGAGGESLVPLLDPERQGALWHRVGQEGLGVILPDHRGVGFSAQLQCRGPAGSILDSFLVRAQMQGYEGFSLESMLKIARHEVSRCIERLSHYSQMMPDDVSVTDAARDLHELILSLRSQPGSFSGRAVHLYGVSYGTFVVQRFMDLFPRGADSFTIDGVVAARGFTFQAWDTYPDLIGRKLMKLCAEDAICNGFFKFTSPESASTELQERINDLATSQTRCAKNIRRLSDFVRTVSPELFAPPDAPWRRNAGHHSEFSTMVRTLGALAVSSGREVIPRSKMCTAMVDAGFASSGKTCGLADIRVSYLSWLHRMIRCDPERGDVEYMTLPVMWAVALTQMNHGNQETLGIDAFVYNTIKFSELWDIDEPLAWQDLTPEGTWQQPDLTEPPEVPLGVAAAAREGSVHAKKMLEMHRKAVEGWSTLQEEYSTGARGGEERHVVRHPNGSLSLQWSEELQAHMHMALLSQRTELPLVSSSLGSGWWEAAPLGDYHRLAGPDVLLRSYQPDVTQSGFDQYADDAVQVEVSHTHVLFRKGSEVRQQDQLKEVLSTWQSQTWNKTLFGTCDFPVSETLSMVWPRYKRDSHTQRWPDVTLIGDLAHLPGRCKDDPSFDYMGWNCTEMVKGLGASACSPEGWQGNSYEILQIAEKCCTSCTPTASAAPDVTSNGDLAHLSGTSSKQNKKAVLPPLLVLTGGLDAHTPEYSAHWAVGNLSWPSTHLVVPGGGHGTLLEPCGADAFGAFLARSKTMESDFGACVEAEPVLNFQPGILDSMMLGKQGRSLWEDPICIFDTADLPPAPKSDWWSLVPDFLGSQDEEEDPMQEPSADELRCGSWRLRCTNCITSCLIQTLLSTSDEQRARLSSFVLLIKDKLAQEEMSQKEKAALLAKNIFAMQAEDQSVLIDGVCGCIDVITTCIEPFNMRCKDSKSGAFGDIWAQQFLATFGSTVNTLTLKGTLCPAPAPDIAVDAAEDDAEIAATEAPTLEAATTEAATTEAPTPSTTLAAAHASPKTVQSPLYGSVILSILAASMCLVAILVRYCHRGKRSSWGARWVQRASASLAEDAVDSGTLLEEMGPAIDGYTGFMTPRDQEPS